MRVSTTTQNRIRSAPDNVVLRRCTTLEEYDACVALQEETWGDHYTDIVPASLLKVSQKIGGIVAGAFDSRGAMAGFVFGMTGVREGRVVHWSHMLAVRKDARGTGLGRKLKLFQRDQLLSMGIDAVQWTFDPLVARNANLNLNSLSATISEYVTDMYRDTGSDLHHGVGMDRFIVTWNLKDPKVIQAVEMGMKPSIEQWKAFPIVNTRTKPNGAVSLGDQEMPSVPGVLVEIPFDVEAMLKSSVEDAIHWRRNTRKVFLWYLGRGYRIEGFYSDPKSKRSFYVMNAHQPR